MRQIRTVRFTRDKHGVMSEVSDIPGLNSVEQQVLMQCPAMARINSASKPTLLSERVTVNHNPDFTLFRMCVEVKGYKFKEEWVKLMKELKRPDLYKVIVCAQRKGDRQKLTQRLRHSVPDIEVVDFYDNEIPWKEWMAYAAKDWQECGPEERNAYREKLRNNAAEIPVIYGEME